MMKRTNYISWDDLFMGIAEISSKRSKDPKTQAGVCIVNRKNRLVSIGYNGLTEGMIDDTFPWDTDEKYDYVIHAEENAILNSTVDLFDCVMYLYTSRGYYPCCDCAKSIVQSGIKEVVLKFVKDDYSIKDKYKGDAAKKMFNAANIKIRILEK